MHLLHSQHCTPKPCGEQGNMKGQALCLGSLWFSWGEQLRNGSILSHELLADDEQGEDVGVRLGKMWL